MASHTTTALLGPEHSFHHIAAASYFGESLNPLFKKSFEEIFASVVSGESDYAILAVQNSKAGFVGNNLISISKNGLYIIDEIKLQIRFFLAVKHRLDPTEIHEIFSHPIAIKQCVEFLKKYPNTKLTEVSSTAEAANMISNDTRKNIAVLAGEQVIEQTKLKVLAEATPEQEKYVTRFVVLSKTFQILHQTSPMIISISGNSDSIIRSIANSQFMIREKISVNNSEETYFEFKSTTASEAASYISYIRKYFPEITLIGCYSECEKIVNT